MSKSTALIQRALGVGADLSHYPHPCPVDALHALGRARHPLASALLHAKMGELDMPKMMDAVATITQEVFTENDWHINERHNYTAQQVLNMFCRQVVLEYFGEPCRKCRGRGVLGRRQDMKHSMGQCPTCLGAKLVSGGARKAKRPCDTCMGKGVVQVQEEIKASKLKQCDACNGAGAEPDSTRSRGRGLRIDHMMIIRVWGERINMVLARVREIEREAMRGATQFLRGGRR